ncbi:unnamed protein product [Schistosoma bovis]|nr:unnamed protein product [Schistosoma bovis]
MWSLVQHGLMPEIGLCSANKITFAFMDIKRLTGEDKLKLSRTYFFAGIGFLPFLWWINVFCFLKELSAPQTYPESKLIRKYVTFSLIGALSWTVVFAVWIITFLNFRVSWGELGDRLSFNIPPGRL